MPAVAEESGIMGFKRLPDNQGMVYMPECCAGRKKYPCPDCFSCQWCGKERCRLCRGKASPQNTKEQYFPSVKDKP